jgi:signal transduction histidine kinase
VLEDTLSKIGDAPLSRESLLGAIINSLAEAVFLFDCQGKLIFSNREAKKMLTATSTELPDDMRTFKGAFLPDGTTPFPQERLPLSLALKGESVTDIEMYVQPPPAPVGMWLIVDARPMRNLSGTITGALVVARDNSASRRLREQLQKVCDEAVASAGLKTEFVANVSHEIRTPLAGILGMSELLSVREESDEESREIAAFILQSAQSLLAIVNDLLDFSKLEADKLTLSKEKFSIASMLHETSTSLSHSAMKKNLKVSVENDLDGPDEVYGDRGRLVQILLNFGHNAVKFTEKGEITIKAERKSITTEMVRVCFSVADTGIGIKPSTQKSLFEPFVQGDGSITRRYGGTGLGLSIAKKLTSLMGGDIGFESEFGQGSKFWVSVPLEYVIPEEQ